MEIPDFDDTAEEELAQHKLESVIRESLLVSQPPVQQAMTGGDVEGVIRHQKELSLNTYNTLSKSLV